MHTFIAVLFALGITVASVSMYSRPSGTARHRHGLPFADIRNRLTAKRTRTFLPIGR